MELWGYLVWISVFSLVFLFIYWQVSIANEDDYDRIMGRPDGTARRERKERKKEVMKMFEKTFRGIFSYFGGKGKDTCKKDEQNS